MKNNIILNTDSYKASHWLQYPPKTQTVYSYLESRGGKYGQTVFFGLQYIMKEYLTTPVTMADIDEAEIFFKAHGEPFNRAGWEYIVTKHGGKLPVRIKAVPEGTLVNVSNVLMTVENTDPECFWLTSYLETMLMRVWYPTTVATQSWHCKKIIQEFLNKSSDDPEGEIGFKLHDFGSRGVSSRESAAIGGAAHLVNFMGSDTVDGVIMANRIYKSDMAGFSIPAAEHSTITTYGEADEIGAYRNMLQNFAKPGAMVAVVSDSYDLKNAVGNIWGKQLKYEVINSGATVIIRPDSGNPSEMVLMTVKLLDENFGSTYNKKGYKVLNHVRVIQGDGIDEDSIREILLNLTNAGYSATNVAFGMGGALLQKVDRDTQRFAYKCSSITIDGKKIGVQKMPKTDISKASKKGELDLVLSYTGGVQGIHTVSGTDQMGSIMKVVYENGEIKREYTLDEIRKRSNIIL